MPAVSDGERWAREQAAQVGRAVRELRGDRSGQWLSDATAALGYRVPRVLITRLELGERKYIAVHELFALAAALGVAPGVLLVWGRLPDGETEPLPGRPADAWGLLNWLGGEQLPPVIGASGLPWNAQAAELVSACRERTRLMAALLPSYVGGLGDLEPGLLQDLRNRLAATVRRIADLGGVLRSGNSGGA